MPNLIDYAIATYTDSRNGRNDNRDQQPARRVWWPRLVLRAVVLAVFAYGLLASCL